MPKPSSKRSFRKAGRRAMHRRYEIAAQAGDAEAMLLLATVHAEAEDPEASRAWFRRAAEAGNAHAMYIVGLLVEPNDPDGSRMWLERAVKSGHRDAMIKLGVRAQEAGDLGEAHELYAQAAGAGSALGMFNLGLLLEESDPTAARSWYEKAVAGGDADAMFNLGRLLEHDDPDAARALWERAAAAGQPEAQERR
ncbi:MAG: sel1 repeat family protein [Actinomycetota bacterium]|nr:sel1 repeat family protein [Actinomycetota bacterium]